MLSAYNTSLMILIMSALVNMSVVILTKFPLTTQYSFVCSLQCFKSSYYFSRQQPLTNKSHSTCVSLALKHYYKFGHYGREMNINIECIVKSISLLWDIIKSTLAEHKASLVIETRWINIVECHQVSLPHTMSLQVILHHIQYH